VRQGKAILEAAELKGLLVSPAHLPNPQDTDVVHGVWRSRIIAAAQVEGLQFTHGVAAKLINIYFKAGLVCGGHHNDPRVQALHPPIDSVLLKELAAQDLGGLRREWNEARRIRWSRFTSDQYERVVRNIRMALGPDVPLWTVEQYWRGYQSLDDD
jgi:hypothetical protein